MATRVESVGTISTVYEERFEVTTEWCVAINNIDYVRQSLTPFVEELGMDEIIQKMCEARSPLEAQRYSSRQFSRSLCLSAYTSLRVAFNFVQPG